MRLRVQPVPMAGVQVAVSPDGSRNLDRPQPESVLIEARLDARRTPVAHFLAQRGGAPSTAPLISSPRMPNPSAHILELAKHGAEHRYRALTVQIESLTADLESLVKTFSHSRATARGLGAEHYEIWPDASPCPAKRVLPGRGSRCRWFPPIPSVKVRLRNRKRPAPSRNTMRY